MTAMVSSVPPTALTVKVYKNGNTTFLGKTLVINRRCTRTMEALYDQITAHISAYNAVRRICTPIGGRPVANLESIKDKSVYVAAGREEFKKLNYADIGASKQRRARKTNDAPRKTIIVGEGRHKMDYEWGKRDLKILYVFCNGDVFKPKVKIVLQKKFQQSMEQILSIVQEHVAMAAAIAALYTKDGKLVLSPSELLSGTDYVAVERGRAFKRMNYGGASSPLSKGSRARFLPHIGNGQLINAVQPQKRKAAKQRPRILKTNTKKKTHELSSDAMQQFSPELPPALGLTQLRESQDAESINNFTISSSPPGWIGEDTPLPGDTGMVKQGNDEEKTSTVGNVFTASGLMKEKADEVRDTRQTKEEKPIDLTTAEEVFEEELHGVEKELTNKGDKQSKEQTREMEKEGFKDKSVSRPPGEGSTRNETSPRSSKEGRRKSSVSKQDTTTDGENTENDSNVVN